MTRVIPSDDPPLQGFTNGELQCPDLREDAVGVVEPAPVRGHHVRPDRQSCGLEGDLHVVLVHADGAGRHAGSDVSDAHHLEEPLDGAVLTEGAVQQCEGDVDAMDVHQTLTVAGGHLATVGAHHPHRIALRLCHVGQMAGCDLVGVDGLQRHLGPSTRGRDTDADHVETVLVDGLEHTRGREARDAVLRRLTSEDECDLDPLVHWASRLVVPPRKPISGAPSLPPLWNAAADAQIPTVQRCALAPQLLDEGGHGVHDRN